MVAPDSVFLRGRTLFTNASVYEFFHENFRSQKREDITNESGPSTVSSVEKCLSVPPNLRKYVHLNVTVLTIKLYVYPFKIHIKEDGTFKDQPRLNMSYPLSSRNHDLARQTPTSKSQHHLARNNYKYQCCQLQIIIYI